MKQGKPLTTSARESLESHLMAFAAEDSRHHRKQINLPDYREKPEAQARSH
jgi:hypothetical protein